MKTELLPGIVEVEASTTDETSMQTDTAYIEIRLRIDPARDPDVVFQLIDAIREVVLPYATHRPESTS
jgi:hypothetical protein